MSQVLATRTDQGLDHQMVVMEDQINMNNVAKAFYRLQVSRTQGPP